MQEGHLAQATTAVEKDAVEGFSDATPIGVVDGVSCVQDIVWNPDTSEKATGCRLFDERVF